MKYWEKVRKKSLCRNW